MRGCIVERCSNLRVGSGVGHGEGTSSGVLQLEVLIGETFTVDGLSTSSL